MSNRYVELMRERRRSNRFEFTAKNLLALLALVALVGSCAYWWGIQSQLTPSRVVAVAYTAILVLAPPSLFSFIIPWSPAGMLLQRINSRTWGYAVLLASAMILVYYSIEVQYAWWATQPLVVDSGLIPQQVAVGVIGFILIPALLWAPVSNDELVEQIRQAHLVRRYELQTQADIAILRNTLIRAQEKSLIGFANLTQAEREELAMTMRGLVRGIDQTMREIAESVKSVSGAQIPYPTLAEDENIGHYLDYVSDTLLNTAALPGGHPGGELPKSRTMAELPPGRTAELPPIYADGLPLSSSEAARRRKAVGSGRYDEP